MNRRIYCVILSTFLLYSMVIPLSSCSLFTPKAVVAVSLPPILSQDELIRPYTTLGRIQVTLDQYIVPLPDVQEWGQRALREEAGRMGADAVTFPEISSRPAPHIVVPATEYRAAGVAIRFK